MHAAAWRCWSWSDSSDLAAGAAGAVTSTPSTHLSRQDWCSRLTSCRQFRHPRTWRAGATIPSQHVAKGGRCCYLHTFIPPVQAGSLLAAHTLPCPGRRPGQPRCAVSCPSSHQSLTGLLGRAVHSVTARGVYCAGVLSPALPSLTGQRGLAAHSVMARLSTVQACCLRPVFPSVTHCRGVRQSISVMTAGA